MPLNPLKVSAALLKTPMDLWMQIRELPLVETFEALAQLPSALERNIRATNELIQQTQAQLAELQSAATAMSTHIEAVAISAALIAESTPKIAASADKIARSTPKIAASAKDLAATTPDIAEMARLAKEQIEVTTVVLNATNENLSEVLRLSAPLEKVGERVDKMLARRDEKKAKKAT